MAHTRHEQDRARLVREIDQTDYSRLLRKLREANQFLGRFQTWADVIAFMHEGNSGDPRKDEILRAIFEAHGADQDPRWRTILLVVFWPALRSINRQKARWDKDQDELWQNIIWVFLKVVCHLDIRKRSNGFARKIFNDTVHRLWDEYQRRFKRSNSELVVGSEELEQLAGAEDDVDYEGIGIRLAQEAEIKRLRDHLQAGRISEEDFFLLVGTRVYGKSAAEYARERQVSSELMRKRRIRAEAVIRRHENDKPSVPQNPPRPPFL